MPMRWGLGPVFASEWKRSSRRWQLYAGRSLFISALLAGLCLVWWSKFGRRSAVPNGDLAGLGEAVFYAVVITQLALVLLAAPAATAGSLCLEKGRGTLAQLLATDLSDAEIILGKLAAQLLPVLGLLLGGAPVLFWSMLLGGIDPEALLGAYVVTLGTALLGCALALALSVRGTKTHEVLLVNYLVWVAALFAYPAGCLGAYLCAPGTAPDWLFYANPFWLAVAPYANPGVRYLAAQAQYLGVTAALAGSLTLWAILRVRAVTLRQAGRQVRRSGRLVPRSFLPRLGCWLPGPSLDRSPVLWREWHHGRPSRWVAAVWGVYAVLAVLFGALGTYVALTGSRGEDIFSMISTLQVALGLLLLSVSAVTRLAEERGRGSLDVLLATPLSTGAILWGKWWGTFRTAVWLAVVPGLTASVLVLTNGRLHAALLLVGLIWAYGAALTSLGLALATWVGRFGLAVAGNVLANVFLCVGWVVVFVFLLEGQTVKNFYEMVLLGSPLYGVANLTEILAIDWGRPVDDHLLTGAGAWIAIYTAVAVLLFLATWLTFDRCLGRVSARTRHPTEQPLPSEPDPLTSPTGAATEQACR